jgi:hypothetical protein
MPDLVHQIPHLVHETRALLDQISYLVHEIRHLVNLLMCMGIRRNGRIGTGRRWQRPTPIAARDREATLLLVRLTEAGLTIAERVPEAARLGLSNWPRRAPPAAPS